MIHLIRVKAIRLVSFLILFDLIVNILLFNSNLSYQKQGSKNSTSFGKHNRSRSCPSVRCALCKYHHHGGIKMSESLNYTPRVTFQEPNQNTVRGSLPDLRPDCTCGCSRVRTNRNSTLRHGDSCGSTESLLDETEDYLRKSVDGILNQENESTSTAKQNANVNRRCSENDIKRGVCVCVNNFLFVCLFVITHWF